MRRIICLLQLVMATWSYPLHNPFQYIYPLVYSDLNEYAPDLRTYSTYIPTYTNEYVQDYATTGYSAIPEVQPTLNVMAEVPYAASNEFSVVPMFIVSENTVNMVSQGHITSISKEQPVMTVKLGDNSVQCTPAVRMVLEKPIILGSLKSKILFPAEVQIMHQGVRIPIRIGAVIAPVTPETYVSQETPVAIKIVYAIPTKPIKITITIEQDVPVAATPSQVPPVEQRFPDLPNEDKKHQFSGKPPQNQSAVPPLEQLPGGSVPPAAEGILESPGFGALSNKPDYVNNADAVVVPNQEAVVVESQEDLPPKNVTVIEFPQQEAEPHLEVDEEDAELVNRNPPLVLAPAGIVQSTQPQSHVEPFHNDKESPYLETLREDAKKKKKKL